jgi:predicted nicotinamide N-methyase
MSAAATAETPPLPPPADDADDAEEEEEWCAWRRSSLSWRERFADDCVLDCDCTDAASCGAGGRAFTVRVAQAAVAGARHGRRAGDAADDPGVTGSTVWDGALVLAAYLSQPRAIASLEARLGRRCVRVLELGAGTGLAGLAVAASGVLRGEGASVVLTDLGAVSDFLAANVARNAGRGGALAARGAAAVTVAPLRWGDADAAAAAAALTAPPPPSPPNAAATDTTAADATTPTTAAHTPPGVDVVIGADVVYRAANVAPLLTALRQLLGRGCVAILALDASHCPEAICDFREQAHASEFDVRDVARSELHAGFRCAEVRVMQLWRR